MGQEFWHRFTGDPDFYKELILAMAEVANEVNMKAIVDDVIQALAIEIEKKYKTIYS